MPKQRNRHARRCTIALRVSKGFDPMMTAKLYRVPYRPLLGCINKPLIHRGTKPPTRKNRP